MNTLRNRTLLLSLALLLAGVQTALARGSARSLHVEVLEADGDGSKVHVTLPLTVIEAFASSLRDGHGAPEMLLDQIGDSGFDLRAFWNEVRHRDINEFFTMEADGAHVRAWREDGLLRVTLDDMDTPSKHVQRLEVSVPERLMDLLFEDSHRTEPVDVVKALEEFGPMTLVDVKTDEESVRIWLD